MFQLLNLFRKLKGRRTMNHTYTHTDITLSKNTHKLHFSKTLMPRYQHKNKANNSQDNMFPLEPRNPTTASPEYCIIDESEIKDSKIVFMNMMEVLKRKWIIP